MEEIFNKSVSFLGLGYIGLPTAALVASKGIKVNGVDIKKGFESPSNWIDEAASKHTSGDKRRMSHKLLEDYRNQLLGKIALEVPQWN